jgi:uncharacterized membrane protein YfcA
LSPGPRRLRARSGRPAKGEQTLEPLTDEGAPTRWIGAGAPSGAHNIRAVTSNLRAMATNRPLELMAIGTVAGLFSGIFGVGGGSVVVPLLVLWLGYGEREASGTSLAAIVFIASFATIFQASYGNVSVGDALLVGVPAVAGALLGTWLQQRLATRLIATLFAAVLIASAVELILQ